MFVDEVKYFSLKYAWKKSLFHIFVTRVYLTVCSFHVTCAFQSESTLYSCHVQPMIWIPGLESHIKSAGSHPWDESRVSGPIKIPGSWVPLFGYAARRHTYKVPRFNKNTKHWIFSDWRFRHLNEFNLQSTKNFKCNNG